jgi:tripeptide aminopeptidase
MTPSLPEIDDRWAVDLLLRLLSVEGVTGRERAIGAEVVAALTELGVPPSAVRYDGAERRIPLPTEDGNLVVTLDGDASLPRRLFMAHRDTVPLCAGARPRREGDRIVPAGDTALGGDDRAGVACLITMVATLLRHRLPRPPLTLLFTVREESGLWGARCVDRGLLGGPAQGFNVDGPSPSRLVVGAVGGTHWSAEVVGRAAHAGLHPEQGISAPLVTAVAMAAAQRRGWWGRVERPGGGRGTANVGLLAGRDGAAVGGATNVVTDYALVEGEVRSHDAAFGAKIVAAWRRAFEDGVRSVRADDAGTATLNFRSDVLYDPFRLDATAGVVAFAAERSRRVGLEPSLAIADGGLDANWMVRHGIPTVTFGAGQRNVHMREEYLDLPDFLAACRLAVALAVA